MDGTYMHRFSVFCRNGIGRRDPIGDPPNKSAFL